MDVSVLEAQAQTSCLTGDLFSLLPSDARLNALMGQYSRITAEISDLARGGAVDERRLTRLKAERSAVQEDITTVLFLAKRVWER